MRSVELGCGNAGMLSLPEGSAGLILSDLPSGETQADFDKQVDLFDFWRAAWACLRPRGAAVLFASSLKFAATLRSSSDAFRYDMVWAKTLATGHLNASHRPLSRPRIHPGFLPHTRRIQPADVRWARADPPGAASEPRGELRQVHARDGQPRWRDGQIPDLGAQLCERRHQQQVAKTSTAEAGPIAALADSNLLGARGPRCRPIRRERKLRRRRCSRRSRLARLGFVPPVRPPHPRAHPREGADDVTELIAAAAIYWAYSFHEHHGGARGDEVMSCPYCGCASPLGSHFVWCARPAGAPTPGGER